MRAISLLLIVFLLLGACSGSRKPTASSSVSSNDTVEQPQLKPGDYVLVPMSQIINQILNRPQDDEAQGYMFLLPTKLEKVQGNSLIVRSLSFVDTIFRVNPKRAIVLYKQEAHKGDFVLTWHDLVIYRGYVLDASDPFKPKVRLLPFSQFVVDSSIHTEVKTLLPGTYRVIDRPLAPGSTVAYKVKGFWYQYFVINATQDSVFAFDWSLRLSTLDRKKVLVKDLKEQIVVGQTVWAPMYGVYTQGKVKKIDLGQVWVKFDFAVFDTVARFTLLDVMAKLD